MRQYLDLIRTILEKGVNKSDPQGVGNRAVCGAQMHFELSDGFPLITTRDLSKSWKAIRAELLWFISGSSDLRDLHRHGVHLWDAWAEASADICRYYHREPTDLGPIYGPMWRHWKTTDGREIDQIATVINEMKKQPESRRHLVTAWNPEEHLATAWDPEKQFDKVFVVPCHCLFHFFGAQGELSLHLFQRSADVLVGVPFNIASYALLMMMAAQVTGLKAREFVHTLSDAHIYLDQISFAEQLLGRRPLSLPEVQLNPAVTDIFAFTLEDIVLENYHPHPLMKIPVSL